MSTRVSTARLCVRWRFPNISRTTVARLACSWGIALARAQYNTSVGVCVLVVQQPTVVTSSDDGASSFKLLHRAANAEVRGLGTIWWAQ